MMQAVGRALEHQTRRLDEPEWVQNVVFDSVVFHVVRCAVEPCCPHCRCPGCDPRKILDCVEISLANGVVQQQVSDERK